MQAFVEAFEGVASRKLIFLVLVPELRSQALKHEFVGWCRGKLASVWDSSNSTRNGKPRLLCL